MLRILRVDTHIRASDRFPAGSGDIVFVTDISQKRSRLSHAVPDHVRQLDQFEPLLNLRTDRGASKDKLLDLTAEGIYHLVMDLLEYHLVDSRDLAQELNRLLVDDRLDFRLENLLHDKRHRDQLVRLDLLESLHQGRRSRSLAQPIDRSAIAERVNELGDKPIHVRHRQHGDHPLVLVSRPVDLAELDRGTEVPVSQHNTLWIAGRAGGVIDDCQIVPVVGRIDHILGSETVGILFGEKIVNIVPYSFYRWIRAIEDFQIVNIHRETNPRSLGKIKLVELIPICQEGDTVRMIKQELDILRGEVSQNRHHHGLVGVHCQVRHAPAGAVPGPESYVLPFLEAYCLKEQVELGDQCRHLGIGE